MTNITTAHKLEELAEQTGATVLTHGGGEKGRYYGRGIISIRKNLGPVNYKCTLAHELAHHILQHDPAATGWIYDRQEAQAERWAATLLIHRSEYMALEAQYGPHPSLLACELGVTVRLLKAWQALNKEKL